MPNPQQPPFDLDAGLEALAGVGKSRRFDAKLSRAFLN